MSSLVFLSLPVSVSLSHWSGVYWWNTYFGLIHGGDKNTGGGGCMSFLSVFLIFNGIVLFALCLAGIGWLFGEGRWKTGLACAYMLGLFTLYLVMKHP
jgi:hypothetical protein